MALNQTIYPTWQWTAANSIPLDPVYPAGHMPAPPAVTNPGGGFRLFDKPVVDRKVFSGRPGVSAALDSHAPNTETHLEISGGNNEPFRVDFDFSESGGSVTEHNTLLALPQSRGTVIFSYTGSGHAFHNGTTEIVVRPGACLTVIKTQLLGDTSEYYDSTLTRVEAGGRLKIIDIQLGGRATVTNYQTDLSGEGAAGTLHSLYYGDGARTIGASYLMRLLGRATNALMNTRGVLAGNSTKNYRGCLDFVRGAKDSVGSEEEYVTLFGNSIVNQSVPLMLCGECDVEGSHAASSGRVDEDAMFYVMSRGLSELEARMLLVEASFEPILSQIPYPELVKSIKQDIHRRLSHDSAL